MRDISFFEDINKNFKEDYTIPGFSRSTTSRNFLFTKGLYAVKQTHFKRELLFLKKFWLSILVSSSTSVIILPEP